MSWKRCSSLSLGFFIEGAGPKVLGLPGPEPVVKDGRWGERLENTDRTGL
jgi:hypothetical protein